MNKRQECVFLWLFAVRNGMYHVLLQHRHDGLFGTPGGKVEDGETLHDALVREIKEEANIEGIINNSLDYLPLGSFESGTNFLIHSFVKQVSLDYLFQIRNNYMSASHASEVAGMSVLELTPKVVSRIRNYPYAGSGTNEMTELLDFLKI